LTNVQPQRMSRRESAGSSLALHTTTKNAELITGSESRSRPEIRA